jgi:hypothetical protein
MTTANEQWRILLSGNLRRSVAKASTGWLPIRLPYLRVTNPKVAFSSLRPFSQSEVCQWV